ncbi:MAG: phosphoenolpyruvate--protein phosphotransferase [Planctomycetales bacterium]|nr:phosphoenolpyruvate--protein phosphotransferase [Planctomycetales bacterium]
MQTFQGIAVSPGVAIGEAFVVDSEGFRIPRRFIERDAVQDELKRLEASVEAVAIQLEQYGQAVAVQLGEQYGAIFSAQHQMLRDARLQTEISSLISQRQYSAEYAVSRTLRRYAKVFQNLENQHMAERAHDIFDIEKRLLRELLGGKREDLAHLSSQVIVVAHDLTPSETANLNTNFVRGFAAEIGGPGGHTAIVAEALEIPAVVGAGAFLNEVSGGDMLIVDGDRGRIILHPDDATLASYRQQAEQQRSQAAQLETLRDLPAETLDGQKIAIMANIEFPREVDACLARGANGIGLYRTEFLYLGSGHEPSEDEHYQAYLRVVQAMNGRPVVIRTLDLGADKMGLSPRSENERNPFLGLRSIRLSLKNLAGFRTQLRAILRASVHGDVRVMFPLISTLSELRQAKVVLRDSMEDLDEAGIAYNRDLPIGMMVEVPATALLIDRFAREVDFLSIGTNDLIQYALAVDRSNREVASLYNAGDPSILQLIKQIVNAGDEHRVHTSLCGQMSSNPMFTMVLIGLGLRYLSVPPMAVPEIKNVCRRVSLAQCEAVAERALRLDTAMEVNDYLKQELLAVMAQTAESTR